MSVNVSVNKPVKAADHTVFQARPFHFWSRRIKKERMAAVTHKPGTVKDLLYSRWPFCLLTGGRGGFRKRLPEKGKKQLQVPNSAWRERELLMRGK